MSNNISQFSTTGLDLGANSKVMTFLYGLSDFWRSMFEDSDKINLMLEANSTQASEIYNHFLQLTSTLSLEGISTLTNSQIKLVLLSTKDKVVGSPSTFSLGLNTISSARFISDKPFLPTLTLEEGIHYFIDATTDTILFYRPLEELGFPSRLLADGTTQYSLWFVDARIDEQLVSKYYGNILAISPETSTDNFSNFVYGLYYLYVNGPVVGLIRKALNLVLGIPLSRGVETVLDIRVYPNSQQYLVTTDANSYLIPYGLTPTVVVGEVIQPFQELTTWVVIKDFVNDGVWWLNLAVPPELIPFPPDGTDNRATVGSHADFIMRNYLYKNTFLVNVNTTSFKDLELFTKLTDVISRARPTYTSPIYIWSVPVPDETLNLDDKVTIQINNQLTEMVVPNIGVFTRDSLTPVYRTGGTFTRFSGPSWMDRQVGTNLVDNGTGVIIDGTSINGFQGRLKQFKTESAHEGGWLTTTVVYSNDNFIPKRDILSFCRGMNPTVNGYGIPVFTNPAFANFRTIYLYTTSKDDIISKGVGYSSAATISGVGGWSALSAQARNLMGINTNPIDGGTGSSIYNFLILNFNSIFQRGNTANLPGYYPKNSYTTLSMSPSDITTQDFIMFFDHGDGTGVSVYWVTANLDFVGRPYISTPSSDDMNVTITGPISRGMGLLGSPYFLTRGSQQVVPGGNRSINTIAIDSPSPAAGSLLSNYSDSLNSIQNMDRSGKTLVVQGYF